MLFMWKKLNNTEKLGTATAHHTNTTAHHTNTITNTITTNTTTTIRGNNEEQNNTGELHWQHEPLWVRRLR